MRNLTLKGYLEKYIVELSGIQTESVSKLILYIDDNPRLLEPLALYATISGTSDRICRRNNRFYEECCMLKKCNDFSSVSRNYEKLYNSYQYACNKKLRQDDTKLLMRKKIILLKEQKNITTYRICSDLNLNRSNTNAFIKNSDCNRLNIETVNLIWKYLEQN